MIKNTTGQHISFIAIATADGAAVTTGTPTVYLSKDGATQATSSNTASHLGNGVWVLDLTQAETNADHLSAVMVLTNAVNSFAQAFPVVQADFKADVSALAVKRLFEFPSTAATANSVSSVSTVSPLIISAKKIYIHLRYSSTVDNTPDANTHREIALQPPTPVNTNIAPSEINLKTYFGSDNRYSISNEISSAEIDITSLGLEVLHGDWTIIVRDNQGMGYNQQVLGASIEFLPLPATIGDATAASQTSISSAISSLNDFDPASDTVANVTLVGTTTTNSDMRGTDGANTVTPNTIAPDNASIAAILVDTADLQANQGQWLTATNFSTFDASTDTVTTDTASRDASKADVSSLATAASIAGLNDFNPTTDTVANVTLVATTTTNTDMRGTDGANTTTPNTVAPDNASISAILADTNELQTNQGDWATATGFATVNPDNASITAIKTTTDKIESMLQGSSSTQTNNFDTDFGDWSTVGYGGGVGSDTTRSTTYAQSGTHSVQMVNANETADRTGIAQTLTIGSGGGTVSGYYYNNRSSHNTDLNLELWIDGSYVSEFTPSSTQTWVQFSFNLSAGSQTVALVRYQDEDAASGVVYIDTISITNVASTSNYKYTADALSETPSSGGGGLDAAGVRTAIGLSSANLDTQLSDIPTVSEFNARTLAAADYFDPASDVVTTDTASRDASKATGFNTVAPDNASISAILADTNELQQNQGDWATATGFATVNPDNASITAIKAKTDSLTFTVANQVDANAVTGGGQPIGSGAISHTVTVNIDNVPANAVDVWVTTDESGTNVVAGTLVTNQAGQATFQLDAGSYYLWCQRSGVNFSNPTAFTVS